MRFDTARSPRRSRRRGLLGTLVALIAGATLLGACSTSAEKVSENTLTYLEPIFFTSLYPPSAGFYPNGGVVNNITDRLLYQDPETLELHPWIATELPEVNEDSTVYTFNIRTDVTYSDGSPLTAENVVANFDLYAEGDDGRLLTGSEQITNYERGEVIDDDTVRFHFSAPAPGFAQATSSFNAGLLADETLELDNSGFAPGNAVGVIGSGPFVITHEDLGTELTLSAREDYDWAPPTHPHQGRTPLDAVHYVLAGEESVRVGGLVAGQADIARQVEAPVERHLLNQGLNVVSRGTNGMNNQLVFRFQHPKLADIRVRQALIHGIDREGIIGTLFSDSYPLATSSVAATALGYRDQGDAYDFDPERAEQLLDEAGWLPGPDGIRVKDGERMSLTVNEAVPQPRSREVITKVQEQLRRIGVEIHLNPGDHASQNADSLDQDNIQIRHTMVGRADYDVIKSLYHSDNRNELLNLNPHTGEIGDRQLEDLLEAIASAPEEAERDRLAGEVQDYLTEQAYVLPLFEEPQVFGLQPYVRDFQPEAIGRPSFYGVSIDEQAAQAAGASSETKE
ncbi:TIGR04028 family ABC transporter substrate-binding protein [Corynebacterium halotolerans]|uniref:TIGR04028 family ABC transporter substrate-binding protein n=1 Tax=Corynebacterium halotolerans TaxID=225326 RepID=UPI003CE9EA9E